LNRCPRSKEDPNPPYQELTNITPKYLPGDNDWSWSAKSRAQGYPADFDGIKYFKLQPKGKELKPQIPLPVKLQVFVLTKLKQHEIKGLMMLSIQKFVN
jgi:hypothetical protein